MKKTITVNMVSESDISVQGHGVHTAYMELAGALEKRSDIKLIRGQFHQKTPADIYHFHTLGVHVWDKFFKKSAAKKVVSAHVIPDSFIGSIILAKYWRFAAKWYLGLFYRKADKVLAVSGMVAKALHDELKVPRENIEVLYNTVDMARYKTASADKKAARKALKMTNDDFIIVGVGQVQPRKRLDVFVELAKRFPDMTFVWVGGIPFKQLGADYKSMQKMMASAPKNLIITDVVPHEKVKLYLQAADVFSLPAEQENHPMCVLEAAGVGLPIILRDIPEYDDTFKNDVLRAKSYDDFAEAVSLLKNSDAEMKKWRKRTEKIAKRFDSKMAAERVAKIYQDILEEKK